MNSKKNTSFNYRNELSKIDEELIKLEEKENNIYFTWEVLTKTWEDPKVIWSEMDFTINENANSIKLEKYATQFFTNIFTTLISLLFSSLLDKNYYKRRDRIANEKKRLLEIRARIVRKISRAYRRPNIRSSLRRILKTLYTRRVGEEDIRFFTYTTQVINLISLKYEKRFRIYKNYRLAS